LSEKYFSYFLAFGATENNNQTENIFGLIKKASLISENDFTFLNFINRFPTLKFFLLKSPDHHQASTRLLPNHHRATIEPSPNHHPSTYWPPPRHY
jgi:hypothetical protein